MHLSSITLFNTLHQCRLTTCTSYVVLVFGGGCVKLRLKTLCEDTMQVHASLSIDAEEIHGGKTPRGSAFHALVIDGACIC